MTKMILSYCSAVSNDTDANSKKTRYSDDKSLNDVVSNCSVSLSSVNPALEIEQGSVEIFDTHSSALLKIKRRIEKKKEWLLSIDGKYSLAIEVKDFIKDIESMIRIVKQQLINERMLSIKAIESDMSLFDSLHELWPLLADKLCKK